MDEAKFEIPWQSFGQLLDKFQDELSKGLAETGYEENSAYLELTIYGQKVGEKGPSIECNLGYGEVGKRLPVDDDIEEGELEGIQPESANRRVEVDRLLRGMYKQLKREAGRLRNDNYLLRLGVRALIYSSNLDYSCSGYRCEWRESKGEWWERRYYERDGECRRRWIEPCDSD